VRLDGPSHLHSDDKLRNQFKYVDNPCIDYPEQTWIGHQNLRLLFPGPAPVPTAEANAEAALVLLFRVNLLIPPPVTT